MSFNFDFLRLRKPHDFIGLLPKGFISIKDLREKQENTMISTIGIAPLNRKSIEKCMKDMMSQGWGTIEINSISHEEKPMTKEFDLKVGDRVKFNNGWIGNVDEIIDDAVFSCKGGCRSVGAPQRGILINKNQFTKAWFKKDGTTDKSGEGRFGVEGIHVVEKLEDKKPLEWVVGRFYKNREGDKYELVADLRNRGDLDEGEETLIFISNGELLPMLSDGRCFDDAAHEWDVIGYWEEPKPKLRKTLEKKIYFAEGQNHLVHTEMDRFLEMDCMVRFDNPASRAKWPRTARVKMEIIED